MTSLAPPPPPLQRGAHLVRDRRLPERKVQRLALQAARQEVHRRGADEAGDEEVDRVLVEHGGRVDLLDEAGAHDGDAVAERHGLGLVVRHVDHRGAEAALDARDLGAHLHAQLGVEVRQRLVHQERLRIAHDRAAHGDALALPAGEVRRLALEVLLEVEDLGGLGDLAVDLARVGLGELEREAHVVAHGHVRVQRVVLEHHRDVAIARREVVDALPADDQVAVGDVLQPGDHPQRRGLPTARRSDQDHELPVGDVEVDRLDRLETVRVALGDLLELDLGHPVSLSSSCPLGTGSSAQPTAAVQSWCARYRARARRRRFSRARRGGRRRATARARAADGRRSMP